MNTKTLPFSLRVEKDGKQYHSWCPELPGCETYGKTVGESLENLKDALQLYLDTIMEEEIVRVSQKLAKS